MMNFQTLTINDKHLFNQYVKDLPWASFYVSSEYVFENLFAWSNEECIQIHWSNRFGIIRCQKQKQTWYFPPIARQVDDFYDAILWIFEYDPQARLIGLTDEMLAHVPNIGITLYDDRLSEYIYDAQSFIHLKGNLFHRKRNLISQFEKKYTFEMKMYHKEDRADVLSFLNRYQKQGGSIDDLDPLMKAIDHSTQLSYLVDLLWVDHQVIALSIGVVSMFNHGIVLFEKADVHYIGSYAAMASMFARRHFQQVKFISRQEDLGIPEIRHSKISYHPIKKDRKYAVLMDPVLIDLHQLYLQTFTEDSRDYIDHFFLNQYDPSRCFYELNHQHIISALHLIPKTMKLHGKSWDAPMIVAAATHEHYRKQGYMRRVIEKTLRAQYFLKTPFLTLYPVEPDFYQSFGFVTYAYEILMDQLSESMDCHLEQTSSTIKLVDIYHQAVSNYDGYMERDVISFRNKLDSLSQDHYSASLIISHHQVHGYMIHRNSDVEEMVLIKPIRPIIPNIQTSQVKVPHTSGLPAQMARIVHLVSFLSAYQPHESIVADVSFCIIDPIIKQNNVCLRLVARHGQFSFESIEQAPLIYSIEAFTKLVILGTNDPTMKDLFPIRPIITYDRY